MSSEKGGAVALALLMARSPMSWERLDRPLLNVAALFLVKRPGGETSLNLLGSGRWSGLNEPHLLNSLVRFSGDWGATKIEEPSSVVSAMVVFGGTRKVQYRRILKLEVPERNH
jgi:hypothetical protein